MKAVYVGAGTDTRPLKTLKNVSEFIYIDCQPYSEFGMMRTKFKNKYDYNGFERPRFINQVISKFRKAGFRLLRNILDIIYFSNNENVIIKYYVNISIPENIDLVSHELEDFQYLIVAGHDPHSKILDFVNNKVIIVGYSGTYYGNEECEHDDTFLYKLYNNIYFRKNKFRYFIYFDKNNKKKQIFNWNKIYRIT
jgi:hypothetical protein